MTSGVAGLASLYLVACGVLAFNARSMLYHPMPRSATVPFWTLQRDNAQIIVSTNDQQSRHVVLYFGGNAEDVSQTLPMLEHAFPQANIHAMHYRSYGGSTGSPSEPKLIGDALALYDTVVGGGKEVTIIGRSLGTGVAIQVAAARPARHLFLITPYYNISELAAQVVKVFPARLLLRDHYDSWRFAAHITTPTTIFVAGLDQVIPNDSTYRLAQQFSPGVATVITIADADHSDISRYPQVQDVLIAEGQSASAALR